MNHIKNYDYVSFKSLNVQTITDLIKSFWKDIVKPLPRQTTVLVQIRLSFVEGPNSIQMSRVKTIYNNRPLDKRELYDWAWSLSCI